MRQISNDGNVLRHFLSVSILLICASPCIAFAEGLGEVLHQVERHAPRLHLASAKVDAANAAIAMTTSRYWGHGELFGQTTRYDQARLVNPIAYPPVLSRSLYDKTTYGYGARYTLPVDIDGRIHASVQAQKHLSEASHEDVQQTRLALFAQSVIFLSQLTTLNRRKTGAYSSLKSIARASKTDASPWALQPIWLNAAASHRVFLHWVKW